MAEHLAALTLATDRAAGLPPDTAVRTGLVAVRLARRAGWSSAALQHAFYAGLLRFLGCSAYSYEMAERFAAGDDLALLRELTRVSPNRPRELLQGAWRGVSQHAPLAQRLAAVARLATTPSAPRELGASHCELAVLLGRKLGMADGVLEALGQVYERWDGRGTPLGLRAEAIANVARVVQVAWRVAAHGALDGKAGAREALQERAGSELDPALVASALAAGEGLFEDVLEGDTLGALLAAEPAPPVRVDAARSLELAAVFGHFSDVKSPWTVGHSGAVARLADEAAARAGLDDAARASLRLAALLHDVGRVAIRNGLWDKRGPLSEHERAELREHALETERILGRARGFEHVAALAGSAHERTDGSGYPRRAEAQALSRATRLLAACDVAVALAEERPQRPARPAEKVRAVLREEAERGALCPQAVATVLSVLAPGRARGRPVPHALSPREVEVLTHVASGLNNAQIARQLHVSAATVKRHLENVFAKTGLRTRAALSVWAVEHGLL